MTFQDKQPPASSSLDDLIRRVYDVALDPERYDNLRRSWETLMITESTREVADHAMIDPVISRHFERAVAVLDRMDNQPAADSSNALISHFENVSAMIITSQLRIKTANQAAMERLSVSAGASLNQLPISDDDISALARQVARMLAADTPPPSIFRARSEVCGRFIVFQMRRAVLENGEPIIIAATSDLKWPKGFEAILASAFELSLAEVEVVRLLWDNKNTKDIAQLRGRSVDTVRTQIKAILAKTESRNQTELVRLVLSMMDMAAFTERQSQAAERLSEGDGGLEKLPIRSVVGADGRRLDYLILGDPDGKPLLFVTSEYGYCRWPASAEKEAKRRGIKIISPLRAGYGHSEPVPANKTFCQQVAEDLLTVLDAEQAVGIPVISLVDDHHFSTMAEKLRPGMFTALIAVAGGLPFLSEAQLLRMDKWYRFIQVGARKTPQLLNFMIKMGYHLLRRIGIARFFQTIYADSAADLATLNEPEVQELMHATEQAILTDKNHVLDSFVRQTLFEQEPWLVDHVHSLKGKMPVHFLCGLQDPAMPAESIAEHQLAFEWIDFRIYPEAGQLLLFSHWRDVLELSEQYL